MTPYPLKPLSCYRSAVAVVAFGRKKAGNKRVEFQSCLDKQKALKARFATCSTPRERYMKIIELGRMLPAYPEEDKTPDRLVDGCQSRLYLKSTVARDRIRFAATADSVISSGLAALFLSMYDREPPAALLKCPPAVLKELGIGRELSIHRASGLHHIYLRMQKEAIIALSRPLTES
ncbi:MAG: SufE family protein [Simkaniaceae bacterium]|nr:SufE family protein [Simkaniaceae bacterium]